MEYKDLSIQEIQGLKRDGQITYVELTQYYLERIKKYEKSTNSIAEINPKALEEARVRDENHNDEVPLLYGIPVLVKDNINTLGMKTTAGAIVLQDFYSKDDAFIIKQLKKQGAIILGKTNLSEFANFISTDSSNGYSALKGQVKNPYGDEFDVCGSSAGTGAAMATSLAHIGIGTETSGSILCPSINNSLVGLKPSVGYISREGIIPISPTQDVPGPMTRTVLDAAILFNGMIGLDEKDNTTEYAKEVNLDNIVKPIKGMKVGYVKSYMFSEPTADEVKLIDKQVDLLKDLGVEITEFTHEAPFDDASFNVLFHEFPAALEQYLENEDAPVKNLKEIIEFNKLDPETRIPFGQDVFEKCFEIAESCDYLEDLKKDQALVASYEKQIREMKLDALVYIGHYATWLPAKGGLPSVTVPAGYIDKRPFGLTFSSVKYTEEKLLQLAYNYEQKSKARINPKDC